LLAEMMRSRLSRVAFRVAMPSEHTQKTQTKTECCSDAAEWGALDSPVMARIGCPLRASVRTADYNPAKIGRRPESVRRNAKNSRQLALRKDQTLQASASSPRETEKLLNNVVNWERTRGN
jgi:hypothetical protein